MSKAFDSIIDTRVVQNKKEITQLNIQATYDDEISVDNNVHQSPLLQFSESSEPPESHESPIKNNQITPLHRNHAFVENLVDTTELIIYTIWTNFPVHSSAQVIPLRLFIQEILRRSRTSWSTLQTTLFYLNRIKPKIASLASNQSSNNSIDRNGKGCDPATCGRRMFLASLIVAAKYLQDRNYANNAWSKISGLSVQEINAIERRFLKLIDYNLYIGENIFRDWVSLHIQNTPGSAATQFLWMLRSQTSECSVQG